MWEVPLALGLASSFYPPCWPREWVGLEPLASCLFWAVGEGMAVPTGTEMRLIKSLASWPEWAELEYRDLGISSSLLFY